MHWAIAQVRALLEIKLDMRVDYIIFTKLWIEKLKDSIQRDPILRALYQLTEQGKVQDNAKEHMYWPGQMLT